MFEAIGSRSGSSPARRLGGFAVAAALHAGALALALFATRPPVIDVIQVPEGPPHVYRPQVGTTVTPIKPPQGNTPPKPTGPRPPRAVPRPVEVEPAPVSAPESNELPAPVAVTVTVGPGDPTGVTAASAPGPGPACPAGQACPTGPSQPEEIISFKQDVMDRPRPNCEPPAPRSPVEAAQFGLEGTVSTLYVVHADGRVGNVRVVNTDAPPIFARAVRDWLESCNFTAARYQGHEVSVQMQQTFRFKSR